MLKWKQAFQCFCGTSGYFTLTLIWKVFDIWSCPKQTFKATVIWNFMQIHPVLARIKLIHLVYSQMGLGSFRFQFRGLLCLGSEVQTVLKAEIDVHTPEGERGPGSVFFKISANVWNMSKITHPHTYSLPLNAAILSAGLNTVVILPWSWQIDFVEYVTQVSKFGSQPIVCHWNVLPMVTVFLKGISGAALLTQKLWPGTYL